MARGETGQKPRVTTDRVKRSGPPIPNEIGATPHAEPKAAQRAMTPPIRGPPVEPTPEAEPKKRRKPRPTAPVELKAYTIPQFCEAYNISIWTYYRIAKEGTGPVISKIGDKTLIDIADAKAWFEKKKVAAKEQRPREAEAAGKIEA